MCMVSFELVEKEKFLQYIEDPYLYSGVHYDKDGVFLGADEKQDVVEKELRLCGYYCIVPSEKMTAKEALVEYKGRDVSEKLFQADKGFLDSESMYVQTSERVESKLFLAFIALIVRNRIYNLLREMMQRMEKRATS